jgi:hypothetical protein
MLSTGSLHQLTAAPNAARDDRLLSLDRRVEKHLEQHVIEPNWTSGPQCGKPRRSRGLGSQSGWSPGTRGKAESSDFRPLALPEKCGGFCLALQVFQKGVFLGRDSVRGHEALQLLGPVLDHDNLGAVVASELSSLIMRKVGRLTRRHRSGPKSPAVLGTAHRGSWLVHLRSSCPHACPCVRSSARRRQRDRTAPLRSPA